MCPLRVRIRMSALVPSIMLSACTPFSAMQLPDDAASEVSGGMTPPSPSGPAAPPVEVEAGVVAPAEAGAGAEVGCVAPDDLALQDQDFDDHHVPWRRVGGEKVVIVFATGNVAPDWQRAMEEGVANWNASPCLETRLVDTCPGGANCVTVRAPAPDTDAQGYFDPVERNGFTVGGHIAAPPDLSEGARRSVMIHLMGHAVGLRHRKTARLLMSSDSYEGVFASDAIDYENLLVLYGGQR